MNKICLFQDYLCDVPRALKEKILEKNEIKIIDIPTPIEGKSPSAIRNFHRDGVQAGYRFLLEDLKRNFGINASSYLYAIINNRDERWVNNFSESSQKFLKERMDVDENDGAFDILKWALFPENWFLIDSNKSSVELQSKISSDLPCFVFANFPLEYTSLSTPDVSLNNLEHILQSTGIYNLWKRGNLGKNKIISVFDTGVAESVARKYDIHQETMGGFQEGDNDGHGTAIVEVIKAISPQSTIHSIKILDSYNKGGIWNLISGITTFFTKQNHTVCMALGVSPGWVHKLGEESLSFQQSIANLLESFSNNMNFPICASGNEHFEGLLWPAASQHALAVGSHNLYGRLSSFSNYSKAAQNFILAPGGDRDLKTYKNESYGNYGPGLTREIVGTSFSTAISSGVVSLLQQYEWFRSMNISSRISLLHNHCRKNDEGFSILNIDDIGAIWPI